MEIGSHNIIRMKCCNDRYCKIKDNTCPVCGKKFILITTANNSTDNMMMT